MSHIAQKLQELGITLPAAAAPAANYVPVFISGKSIVVSGQLPFKDGSFAHAVGKLGDTVSVEKGQEYAKYCAINILAQINQAVGDLENVRCVKLGVFVNGTADFMDQSAVANGASDFMVEVLGDKGRHARSAVGVASLPFGVAVEVDAVFEAL
jgi:enamine deaminase RidA (YjgF/YER057c/UK114 family)